MYLGAEIVQEVFAKYYKSTSNIVLRAVTTASIRKYLTRSWRVAVKYRIKYRPVRDKREKK